MSYGLIPLGRKADKELLERYQYLQKFLKESKEFGAQRQESEKKAVSIALQNLARNSGYGDVTRLTWSMETELIKELLPYLTPKEIDGVEVYVQVSEEGKSEIKQIKAGKELNSMPAISAKKCFGKAQRAFGIGQIHNCGCPWHRSACTLKNQTGKISNKESHKKRTGKIAEPGCR